MKKMDQIGGSFFSIAFSFCPFWIFWIFKKPRYRLPLCPELDDNFSPSVSILIWGLELKWSSRQNHPIVIILVSPPTSLSSATPRPPHPDHHYHPTLTTSPDPSSSTLPTQPHFVHIIAHLIVNFSPNYHSQPASISTLPPPLSTTTTTSPAIDHYYIHGPPRLELF